MEDSSTIEPAPDAGREAVLAEAPPAGPPAVGPVAAVDRIASLDVLRGVAVLGILLMNIVGLGLPGAAYSDPTAAGGAERLDLAAWAIAAVLFEGSMRGLFSLLFGAGVIILTSRLESRGGPISAADVYYRRNLWLIVFGVVHAYLLLWTGEVLFAYGVVGLFLYPLRKLGPRVLLTLGLVCLAVLVPKRIWLAEEVKQTREAYNEILAWDPYGASWTLDHINTETAWRALEQTYKPTPQDIQWEVDLHRGGYLQLVEGLAPANRYMQSEWFYRWTVWDVLGFMLLGMALQKLGYLSGKKRARVYAAVMAVGYAVGLLVNAYEVRLQIAHGFQLDAMMSAMITNDAGRLGMTLGHLSLVLLACQSRFFATGKASLAAVGRMALSNYVGQTVICVTLFSGFGLDLFDRLDRHELYYVVAAVWTLQLLASPLWLRYFRFGPLEWAWRSLTYWRVQPLLAERAAARAVL